MTYDTYAKYTRYYIFGSKFATKLTSVGLADTPDCATPN